MSTEPLKVLCFDTLSQVLILKVVSRAMCWTTLRLEAARELADSPCGWWTEKSPKARILSAGKLCRVGAKYFTKLQYKNSDRVVNKKLGASMNSGTQRMVK